MPVHKGGEQALYFRRHIVWKLPRIHIGSVSGALKAVEKAESTAGRTARVRGDGGEGGVRRRLGSAGPIGRDGVPAGTGHCGGAVAAQGMAPGPTARKIEERENFARLVQLRELTMGE